MKKSDVLRFMAVAGESRRSAVWRLWTWRDDFYLAPRHLAKSLKVSFHASGQWQAAFNKRFFESDEGAWLGEGHRALARWLRSAEVAAGKRPACRILIPDDALFEGELRADLREKVRPFESGGRGTTAVFSVWQLGRHGPEKQELLERLGGQAQLVGDIRLESGGSVVVTFTVVTDGPPLSAWLDRQRQLLALGLMGNRVRRSAEAESVPLSETRAIAHGWHDDGCFFFLDLNTPDESALGGVIAGNGEALFEKGILLVQGGQLERALDVFRTVVDHQPDHWRALGNCGVVCLALSRPEDALSWIERALAVQPEEQTLLLNRGAALLALGRREEARRVLEGLVGTPQLGKDALHNLGVLLSDVGEYDESVKVLKEALKLGGDTDTIVSLGKALFRAEGPEASLVAYSQALESAPSNPKALLGKAEALLSLGRYEEALTSLGGASWLLPKAAARALFGTARARVGLGDLEGALSCLDRLPGNLKGDGAVAEIRVVALCRLGQLDEALRVAERARRDFPENRLVRGLWCWILMRNGRHQECIDTAAAALTDEPDNEVLHRSLALSYLYSGQGELALVHIQRCVELDRDAGENFYNRACIQVFLGNLQAALEDLRIAASLNQATVDGMVGDPDLAALWSGGYTPDDVLD